MTRHLIDVLTAFITAHPTQRIRTEALLQHATTTDPTLLGDPTARTRLATAFTELAQAGTIQLPRTRSGWDERTQPPLPRWIAKPTVRTRTERPVQRVWPQPLERAAALATRPDEHALLDRIASWLRDNPNAEPVPIEERSLEILDDEKALATLTTKRLFATGSLTLDLLACYATPVPFPSQHVPGHGEPRLLIAENNATFHSLLATARSLDPRTRPNLHIGWGCGNQFPVSITAMTLLAPQPAALYYFGDLDAAGLRIAANAATTATARHLPTLRPAANLYRWLLANGTPRPDRSNTGLADPTPLLTWLPADLHPAVGALLATRQRIPQERLGLRDLRADPSLLVQAVRAGHANPSPS
ncbi:Wadjet anti-phage system protein JetD domain-containing protein [Streptacidiphilus cavernicola]|uniref:Wadjet anti-phage system protein JetD domain-containing protein n=1 Tax=Streptacidiphilus cavernicola TaxID=3342716 RepID=A0ABV6W558_9ACTN